MLILNEVGLIWVMRVKMVKVVIEYLEKYKMEEYKEVFLFVIMFYK